MIKTRFHKISFLLLNLSAVCIYAQTNFSSAERKQLKERFESGKMQFGVGISLKVDIIKNTFGYYRLSVTGGAGVPFGRELGLRRNTMTGYYFVECDVFRGGLGAPALALDNQQMLIELRQSFLLSVGRTHGREKFNYNRPVMQFISNSSHPLFDPYNLSLTLGSTFINGLNIRRSQRVGIVNLGWNYVQLTYLNDGPPFTSSWLPFGDGFDRYWTGSGQVGVYFSETKWMRNIELKYDKFTGLQPYAYELATALHLKHIPYRSKETRLFNRQRYEIGIGTNRGIGFSMNVYDSREVDIQHYIHNNKYSYHDTPLKWRIGAGLFYNNAFIIR
jgi:hypothetical protein